MKIWLVERIDKISWYEYDAFVVIAESQEEAIDLAMMDKGWNPPRAHDRWKLENVKVVCLGQSKTMGLEVILGSFNAG